MTDDDLDKLIRTWEHIYAEGHFGKGLGEVILKTIKYLAQLLRDSEKE